MAEEDFEVVLDIIKNGSPTMSAKAKSFAMNQYFDAVNSRDLLRLRQKQQQNSSTVHVTDAALFDERDPTWVPALGRWCSPKEGVEILKCQVVYEKQLARSEQRQGQQQEQEQQQPSHPPAEQISPVDNDNDEPEEASIPARRTEDPEVWNRRLRRKAEMEMPLSRAEKKFLIKASKKYAPAPGPVGSLREAVEILKIKERFRRGSPRSSPPPLISSGDRRRIAEARAVDPALRGTSSIREAIEILRVKQRFSMRRVGE